MISKRLESRHSHDPNIAAACVMLVILLSIAVYAVVSLLAKLDG